MHLAVLTWLFNALAQQVAPIAVTGLWQGLAVAFTLALCLKFAPRVSAAHRFALWGGAFVVTTALPLAPLVLGAFGLIRSYALVSSYASLAAPAPASLRPWLQVDSRWTLAIAGLWLIATAVRAADLLFHLLRLRRLWRTATLVEVSALEAAGKGQIYGESLKDSSSGAEARAHFAAVTARLKPPQRRGPVAGDPGNSCPKKKQEGESPIVNLGGLPPIEQKPARWVGHPVSSTVGQRSRWTTDTNPQLQGVFSAACLPKSQRGFEVCRTQSLDRPGVIGFFAPRILIPHWLLPRLTPGELDQIVLHESTHLARRDDWTNLFQKLCLVFFPLNPVLWWIDRQLAKEREMACDEAVVRITQAPRAYAACLTSLAERGMSYRRQALSLGAWQRRSELVDRVHRILRGRRSLHPIAGRVLLGSLASGLLVVSLELARCPQLVAFVAPAQTTNLDAQAAELGDAVYPSNPQRVALAPGAHVVQAKAVLPAAQFMKPHASRARNEAAHRNKPATEPVAVPRQFIVFTAWERVETSAPIAQNVADYDTNPVGTSSSSETASNPGAQSTVQADPNSAKFTSRFTVTRLIFRVVATNAQTGSKPVQPMAIPIGDGWFVIQL